jgi:hypothetical protein
MWSWRPPRAKSHFIFWIEYLMSLMLCFIVFWGTLSLFWTGFFVYMKVVDHFIYESREDESYFMYLSLHDGLFWAKLSCHFLVSCFGFEIWIFLQWLFFCCIALVCLANLPKLCFLIVMTNEGNLNLKKIKLHWGLFWSTYYLCTQIFTRCCIILFIWSNMHIFL